MTKSSMYLKGYDKGYKNACKEFLEDLEECLRYISSIESKKEKWQKKLAECGSGGEF